MSMFPAYETGMYVGNKIPAVQWIRALNTNETPRSEVPFLQTATNYFQTQDLLVTFQGGINKHYLLNVSGAIVDATTLATTSIFDANGKVWPIDIHIQSGSGHAYIGELTKIFRTAPTIIRAIQTSGTTQTSYQSPLPLEVGSRPSTSLAAALSEIASKIAAERTTAVIDAGCSEIADAAAVDAIKLVDRNRLPGIPHVIFSNDGILALQWERGEEGTALMFAGDGLASIVFRTPAQFYAENGVDVTIEDELPVRFTQALARIVS
jgi:hypothetical protein